MNKLHVLQMGNPTELYGAERWIIALIRNLDPYEILSIVSVIRDNPGLIAPLCREARFLRVKTHVFKAYGRFNWKAVKQLSNYIVDNNIDILHTHGYKTNVVGLLPQYKQNVKLLRLLMVGICRQVAM